MTPGERLAQFLYGFLFVVVLPALLVLWARQTAPLFSTTLSASPPLGFALLVAGLLLMISAMWGLWVYGRGLPMNYAPPSHYVDRGVFRITPHPIYTGFCIACAGTSIATGSASGLWLITPVAIIGCFALVLGYERQDLLRRFGRTALEANRILPAPANTRPTNLERFHSFLHVFGLWALLYGAMILRGVPARTWDPFLAWEKNLPVWEWTEAIYFSCYPLAILSILAAPTGKDLRRFAQRAWFAMALSFLLFFLLPVSAEPRPFSPQTALGRFLQWERGLDTPAAAFPSFHVIWAIFAAWLFSVRFRRTKGLWVLWAVAVAASCVTTGMHALADILAAALVSVAAFRAESLWRFLRRAAEFLANSWRAWQIGPVRVINHSIYAAVAGCAGALVGLAVAGPQNQVAFLAIVALSLAGAALWAQWLEATSGLQRPFGYYGSVCSVIAGIILVPWLGGNRWAILTAFAVGAPWTQAIGRLRCLVQGCCHGSPAPQGIGIRYEQAMSRVVRLSPWRGVPLHPTQLYSLVWNVLSGLILGRLYILGAAPQLLGGLYLILNGAGRFVEESYRGEPQTPVYGRLRLYQWLAIASVLAGAVLTAFPNLQLAPRPAFQPIHLVLGAAVGIVSGFLMGVDFPHANRRFARLA